jgi:hypothetical protein
VNSGGEYASSNFNIRALYISSVNGRIWSNFVA